MKISISQSMIKAFRKNNYCSMQLKVVYLDKTHKLPSTLSMDKGVYFETQTLGSGVHGKVLHDLPRLQSGKKSADHKRIDMQIARFPDVLKAHGMTIHDKDVYLEYQLPSGIWINGTIDFTSSIWDHGPIAKAIVDLKLTGNITSTFGDFCWGDPKKMKHDQAFMYSVLYKLVHGEDLPFYYLVFDYKPVPEYKLIKKSVGMFEKENLKQSIRETLEKINFHESKGWFTNPMQDNCKNCPLASSCPDANHSAKIITV